MEPATQGQVPDNREDNDHGAHGPQLGASEIDPYRPTLYHPYGPYDPQDGEDGVARDGERVVPESGREIAVHERVGAAQAAAPGAVDPRVVEERAGGVVARLVRVDGPDIREARADRGEDAERDGQSPQ
jgi:hypothetical protein